MSRGPDFKPQANIFCSLIFPETTSCSMHQTTGSDLILKPLKTHRKLSWNIRELL